jgi:hypothetical protein
MGVQLKSKTLEPYRRQHELPAANAIAQHCSPATFFILRFHFRQEKFGVHFKTFVISLSYSLYIA